MSRRGFPARRAAMGGVSFWLFATGTLLTRPLSAQYGDEPPPELTDTFGTEPELPAPAPPASPPPQAPSARVTASATPVASVELLAPEALPSPRARGIPGGSLSSTLYSLPSHGEQWPYLPARPGLARTRLGLSGSVW